MTWREVWRLIAMAIESERRAADRATARMAENLVRLQRELCGAPVQAAPEASAPGTCPDCGRAVSVEGAALSASVFLSAEPLDGPPLSRGEIWRALTLASCDDCPGGPGSLAA